MPTDGGSRGPGGGGNTRMPRTYKGDGPGANRTDGPPGGGAGHSAHGMTRGRPGDLHSGSPMRGPSMGGVLKYIRERGSGENTAPGSGGSAIPSGASAGSDSPIPTGGGPHEEFNEGNDMPGESREESAQESSCGHPGCTQHSSKGPKYDQSNKETKQFGHKAGGR